MTHELHVYAVEASRMLDVYHQLHRQILDVFNEYGIQIMTPSYMADPAVPKVVSREHRFDAPATPPESRGDV